MVKKTQKRQSGEVPAREPCASGSSVAAAYTTCRGWKSRAKCASRRRLEILPTRFVVGTLEGKQSPFLSRHARGHRFTPTEINYRANIHAMKQLGAERIISVSAVGSLQEELKPLDFLIPDQFYDRTRHRVSTLFWRRRGCACGLWQSGLRAAGRNAGQRMRLRQRCACTAAARTSAWKGRNFPRWPNRMSIANCIFK